MKQTPQMNIRTITTSAMSALKHNLSISFEIEVLTALGYSSYSKSLMLS